MTFSVKNAWLFQVILKHTYLFLLSESNKEKCLEFNIFNIKYTTLNHLAELQDLFFLFEF